MFNARAPVRLAGLAVLFTWAAGCGPRYPDCDLDSQCADHGEHCVDRRCVECSTDAVCRRSRGPCAFCGSRFACEKPSGLTGDCCASDLDCRQGKCWKASTSEQGTCAACGSDFDCQAGHACEAGTCRERPSRFESSEEPLRSPRAPSRLVESGPVQAPSRWAPVAGSIEPAATRGIVAVFNVELIPPVRLAADKVAALSEVLNGLIMESGRYRVVPREAVLRRIAEAKTASYQDRCDESCRIELGRELAADRSIVATVVKVGATCRVTTTMYDLKTATSDGAASVDGACTEDGLRSSLEGSVARFLARFAH